MLDYMTYNWYMGIYNHSWLRKTFFIEEKFLSKNLFAWSTWKKKNEVSIARKSVTCYWDGNAIYLKEDQAIWGSVANEKNWEIIEEITKVYERKLQSELHSYELCCRNIKATSQIKCTRIHIAGATNQLALSLIRISWKSVSLLRLALWARQVFVRVKV